MTDPHMDEWVQQPNSRMCFVCGVVNPVGLNLRFYNDGPNACRANVILGEQYQGYPGVAHGGIVATMLDEAMGRAAMSGNPDRFMFTAKIEIRYRQHVPTNQPLALTARIEKDKGRIATAVGEVRLLDGTVAAEAVATLMEIPRDELNRMGDKDSLGWQVYP
ncbi:MAG: PaaI family thioesterase [Anaerolineae bacterium]|nr:PaaI family thioesterase [Anaerolineae bacterium]